MAAFFSSTKIPPRCIPWLLALVGFLSVAGTLDVADDCRWSAEGPGLTFDEGFNVEVGVYLVESFFHAGLGLLHPATLADIYNDPNYNPDHPPLGRIALGLSNALLRRLSGEERIVVVTYARLASALEYGLLILLVSRFCLRRSGPLAATAAGLSLLLTPRLWGHAHLAALETGMNLTYAAFILFTIERWTAVQSPHAPRSNLRPRDGILPGVLLGLALLTKMQAVFLPPVFVVWALWYWRQRAILPICVVALVSAAVFFVGWPWLWADPIHRFFEYFVRSTDRITLYCYYVGERFTDRDVPWHFPWVTFVVTTPILWLALGGIGLWRSRNAEATTVSGAAKTFLLAAMLLPMIVFSLPGITVYDGERLFLVAWPLFAVFIGQGAVRVWNWAARTSEGRAHRRKWGVATACGLGLLFPLFNLVSLHPCQLSYYSEVVGGLRGANRLGFESTYWGDAVTPEFLQRCSAEIPEGATIAVAPLLHPAFLQWMHRDSWMRHRPDVTFEPYDDTNPNLSRYVLVIRRHADPWDSLTPPPEGTEVLQSVVREGVTLTELLRLPEKR